LRLLLLRIKQRHGITAEQEINNDENHGPDSAAHGKTSAPAGPTNIFNILAFSSSLPEHYFVIVARDLLASTVRGGEA